MPHRMVDHHQAKRFAAGHAELFLVDPAERHALVEFERPLEVAGQLFPGDRQQPDLDAAAGLDAGDQPGEPAPATFKCEKPRLVQDGVELIAKSGIDRGDVAVECRAQPVSAGGKQAGQALAEPGLQRSTEVLVDMRKVASSLATSACCWVKNQPARTDSRRGRRC